jgi:hypothetical protein
MAIEVSIRVCGEDDPVTTIKRVRLTGLIAYFPNNFAVPLSDHPIEVD